MKLPGIHRDDMAPSSTAAAGRRSVRTLLIWLVLACLLPGMIGASALFLNEYREARAQQEKDTTQTVRALSQAVDTQISKIHALAEALATADSLAADDLASFHRQVLRTLEKSGEGTVLSLVDRTGQVLLNSAREYGTPLPRHGDVALVQRVFETGRPMVSNLFDGTVLGRPLVSVSVPVVRAGEIAYVLTIGARPEDFKSILTAQGLPEGWVATILDGSNTIVARSRELERYMGQKPAPEFGERRGTADEGALEFVMADGVPVLSVYTRSPLTGWTVAVNIPLEALRAQLVRRLAMMGLVIVALFIIGIGLAWVVGDKIGRAIRTLREQAIALGTGQALSLPRLDVAEVAEVTESMNKASGLLRERTAALQASEEKYRTLFANMTEGFILGEPVLDADGKPTDVRFLEVNEAFHVHTGVPRGAGGSPLRQHHPRVEALWVERFSAVALTGNPDRFDSYNADTQRHYDVYVFRPAPGRFAVVGRDITEQKRMEAALRRAETRFRCLCESNLVGIVVADAHGGIVEANDYFLSLVGLGREAFEAGQVDWRAITPPEWIPADKGALAELAATGTCTPYEKEYLRPDGSRRTAYVFDALLPGENGLILALVLDITDRRRAERDLERFNADLERQVRARTTELVQSQKMEAIGKLTGGVAHDFNNVLQGLASSLHVIERHLPAGAPHELLESAKQSIDNGARLTRALLAFARRQALQPEPLELTSLFESMRPLLERTLGGLIQVELDVDPGTPAALVDRAQFESALLNLAINARDAMPTGGRLTVHGTSFIADGGTPSELAPGEYVAISVGDTGTGIDESILSSVFEPFFTTKRFGEGSGLGLSMVHGMAAQSGGCVAIASETGRGTTVTLYLPRARSRPKAPAGRHDGVRDTHGAQGATILLVDDNDLMRDALTIALESLGYRVRAAASGAAALSILQDTKRVDVLVTDYAMSGMNGISLAREARRLVPALPVLLITGYAEAFEGMEDIALLHKPFKTEELAANLVALVGQRAPVGAAAR